MPNRSQCEGLDAEGAETGLLCLKQRELQLKIKLKIQLRNNDLKLQIIVSHRWPLRRGKVRMTVKVKVVDQGMTRWKPGA